MKQTAVEWLKEELKKIPMVNVVTVIEQAKEMERKQMMDSFISGGKSRHNMSAGLDFKTFEEYFEETYTANQSN